MHSGNVGHAQNLDALVYATTYLRDFFANSGDLARLVIAAHFQSLILTASVGDSYHGGFDVALIMRIRQVVRFDDPKVSTPGLPGLSRARHGFLLVQVQLSGSCLGRSGVGRRVECELVSKSFHETQRLWFETALRYPNVNEYASAPGSRNVI